MKYFVGTVFAAASVLLVGGLYAVAQTQAPGVAEPPAQKPQSRAQQLMGDVAPSLLTLPTAYFLAISGSVPACPNGTAA
jgi:4-carboxymuconolactone decarboxylase